MWVVECYFLVYGLGGLGGMVFGVWVDVFVGVYIGGNVFVGLLILVVD